MIAPPSSSPTVGYSSLATPSGSRTAIWDPVTDTWIEAGLGFTPGGVQTKTGVNNEETWTLLPNGNVLAVQITGTTATRNAEQYVPTIIDSRWVSAGLDDPESGGRLDRGCDEQ